MYHKNLIEKDEPDSLTSNDKQYVADFFMHTDAAVTVPDFKYVYDEY